jgi:hypothetical protein
MDRRHPQPGRVPGPDRGGSQGPAVSALRRRAHPSLRNGNRLAALRVPGLPLQLQCVDRHTSGAAALPGCAESAARHEAVNVRAGTRTRGTTHIQNVNSWHSRFKTWLVRFKGVASRYLVNYSGWQRLLDACCGTTNLINMTAIVERTRTQPKKRPRRLSGPFLLKRWCGWQESNPRPLGS